MGLFGRIFRLIKGWLLIGVEKAEDPEVILAEAQDAMRRELEKAKENAVQAIAARNQLRGVLQEQLNKSAGLEAQARTALRAGEEDLARQLLIEKSTYDKNIEGLQTQLQQAEQASEAVKASIKQMEARVRQRAAQRLALVAGWKQAKIQEQIERALSGIQLDGHDQAFTRAEERIRELQAKADARQELAQGGLQQKMAKLEDVVATEQANDALAAMKAQMGMTAPVQQTEDPLAKLKAEIASSERAKEEQPIRNLEV
jgi:phage shock protein A